MEDGGRGGDERHGRDQDFIARSDTQPLQSQEECRRSVRNRDGVFGSGRIGEGLLERLRARSRRNPAGLDCLEGAGEFVAVKF